MITGVLYKWLMLKSTEKNQNSKTKRTRNPFIERIVYIHVVSTTIKCIKKSELYKKKRQEFFNLCD